MGDSLVIIVAIICLAACVIVETLIEHKNGQQQKQIEGKLRLEQERTKQEQLKTERARLERGQQTPS